MNASEEAVRNFGLGDLLSVTTGKLVSRKHIGGVYEVLDFMTGDSLMTHQLPRVSRQCTPELLRQHPWLADVEMPEKFEGKEHVLAWLDTAEQRHGAEHPVVARAPEYRRQDALAELDQMAGTRPVITVSLAQADGLD